MAISCILKLWVFVFDLAIIAKYINVILNASIVLGAYCIGRYLSYCKLHKFLCDYCLYGYIIYLIYLIFGLAHNNWYTYLHLIIYTILFIFISIKSYKKLIWKN